jgi:hypothetical protein
MMNPRRVHELMTANLPEMEPVAFDWVNVLEADGTIRSQVLESLLNQFIHADDVLIEVTRKLGDLKPRDQVISYVQEHVGKSHIRMADREFRGYVLIAPNGVAAGGRLYHFLDAGILRAAVSRLRPS